MIYGNQLHMEAFSVSCLRCDWQCAFAAEDESIQSSFEVGVSPAPARSIKRDDVGSLRPESLGSLGICKGIAAV
jgi:hypothetical protein